VFTFLTLQFYVRGPSDPAWRAREAFAATRKDFVIGVKEAAFNGRTSQGGRWLA